MGDLEQYELHLLMRDVQIDNYNSWWEEFGLKVETAKWGTLLSWRQFSDYCIKCGVHSLIVKATVDGYEVHQDMNDHPVLVTTQGYYQFECGHYVPKEVYDFLKWDDEIGWVAR